MLTFPKDFEQKKDETPKVETPKLPKVQDTTNYRAVVMGGSLAVAGLGSVTRQPVFLLVLIMPVLVEMVELYKVTKKAGKK